MPLIEDTPADVLLLDLQMERSAMTEQTVKSHLNNVFEKLGIQDRAELTVYAIRTGIIGLHERL